MGLGEMGQDLGRTEGHFPALVRLHGRVFLYFCFLTDETLTHGVSE